MLSLGGTDGWRGRSIARHLWDISEVRRRTKRPTGRGRRRGLILTFTRRHAEVNNVDPHAECLYESVRLGVKDGVADARAASSLALEECPKQSKRANWRRSPTHELKGRNPRDPYCSGTRRCPVCNLDCHEKPRKHARPRIHPCRRWMPPNNTLSVDHSLARTSTTPYWSKGSELRSRCAAQRN